MDEQEEYWLTNNPAVFFITALQDVGQPYTCEEWGDRGIEGYPLIVEDPNSGLMFGWLHDSWNALPSYVILDHTMTVRAKPWPYSNNGNSNSCDGSNNTIDGWNGGDANDFISQLIDECGVLCLPCDQNDSNDSDNDGIGDDCDNCEGYDDNIDLDQDNIPDGCDECPNDSDNDLDGDQICGDVDDCPNDPDNDIDNDQICSDLDLFPNCHNFPGDLDDNIIVDVQDIILVLNIILEDSDSISICQEKDADLNSDRLVNIVDILGMISIILGN